LPQLGLLANLVEFPAVPKGQARFRMQVMAKHSDEHIRAAVSRLRKAYDTAKGEMDSGSYAEMRAIA